MVKILQETLVKTDKLNQKIVNTNDEKNKQVKINGIIIMNRLELEIPPFN